MEAVIQLGISAVAWPSSTEEILSTVDRGLRGAAEPRGGALGTLVVAGLEDEVAGLEDEVTGLEDEVGDAGGFSGLGESLGDLGGGVGEGGVGDGGFLAIDEVGRFDSPFSFFSPLSSTLESCFGTKGGFFSVSALLLKRLLFVSADVVESDLDSFDSC